MSDAVETTPQASGDIVAIPNAATKLLNGESGVENKSTKGESGTSDCLVDTLVPVSDGVCAPDPVLRELRKFLIGKGVKCDGMTNPHLIRVAEKILGVKSELEIWMSPEFQNFVSSGFLGGAGGVRNFGDYFKPVGPATTNKLLNNYNIDETLHNWEKVAPELINRKFKHIPFQMIDFASPLNVLGNELRDIDLPGIAQKYDCFGVVLNTDTSLGHGKHWFCLFGDLAHTGAVDDPYIIEFFNSSGNGPVVQITRWFNTLRTRTRAANKYVDFVVASRQQLQKSKTECGMWSLLYIKSRLLGRDRNYFHTENITDAHMLESRSLLFRKT